MKGKKLIIGLFMPFLILFGFTTPNLNAANEDTVKSYIKNYYVDEVDPSLLEQDLENIFEQLDPYSTYFTKEEYQAFKDNINQKFVGIGVGIEKVGKGIYLNQVFDNSPAKEAGLKVGDIIVSADGTSLLNKSIEQSVGHIKGKAGTSVNLEILRDSETISFTVKREQIQLPSVKGQMLGGDIGYLQLYTFSQLTTPELIEEASKLDNPEEWIIDVRNNPGGYLTASQQVLGTFPDVTKALIAEYRSKSIDYDSMNQNFSFEDPVSLLINENSASASEILAGSLQDQSAATLYGSTTFGKGLLQELIMLPNGGAVKLSTARFFTPAHNQIQNVGINPDIQSEEPLEDAHKDALQATYDSYTTFQKDQVSPEKTFEIELSEQVSAQSIKSSISLIEVGGKEVSFNLTSEGQDILLLSPNKKLSTESDYMMIIRPGWENADGVPSIKGYIQPIQVTSK